MSRCFPFPPPGYEKKSTTDDLDLLKKEKRKEKKHKKDKKDKEKKEGKEKREKDRSEGKHKEKKDKKDKHRDKKKDKEKGKTSTQDEGYNGEKHNEQIQDKKQSLQFRNGESNKDRTSSSDDKKQPSCQPSTQFQGQNGDLARNRDTENFKFVQELDRRIRDEEKGTGSHQFFNEGRKNSYNSKVEMQNAMARNKINGATPPPSQPPLPPPPQPLLDHKIERRFDQKEKMQESDDRRGDKRKNKDRDKQRAGKEKDSEKEKKEEKSKEKSERDKNKHIKKSDIPMATLNNLSSHFLENNFQGVGSEGILKKRKEMETNGVSHENEPRPNKMARPISNISPENGRKLDFPQNPSSSFLDNQRASQNNFKMGGGKSQKVNGIIPPSPTASVPLPAKKPPIPATFNHLHHKPSPIKSPPPPVITNHFTAQSPPVTTTKPPPPIPIPVPAKQPVSRPKPPPAAIKAVAAAPPPPPPKKKPESVKPPHPDTKYLNQILTVPKPDEWGGVDDQEWLFNTAAPPPPLPRATMADVQVWSEAKHIESVDVCALPYVIPY